MNAMDWNTTSALQNDLLLGNAPDGRDNGLLSFAILEHKLHSTCKRNTPVFGDVVKDLVW